ncbi:MAG: ABC transporter permease [Pseudomonadota bacterium]
MTDTTTRDPAPRTAPSIPVAEAVDDLPTRLSAATRFRLTLMRDKKALFGLIVLVIFSLAALFAPLVAPYDPNAMDYEFMMPPSLAHPLGTDDLGRDLLSRIIQGAQISLFVGVSTVAIALVAGLALGLAAGYFGGWIDNIIMRYIDLQWAFPNIIIAVYLVAVFGTGLLNIIIALSLAFIDDFARVVRGMVLSIKQEQYVAAARTVGVSDFRIMWRHILPNAAAPIIVQATVSISYAILGEATLSFLGLGVEADTPTWGLILAEGRSFISRAWWIGVFPGLAIMLTVLAINFLGDALRDFLDVRDTETGH